MITTDINPVNMIFTGVSALSCFGAEIKQMQIPADGIYASTVTIDGKAYPAVTNIGCRPSVTEDSHIPNIETHIIGYSGWLYDEQVTVSFRERLRDETRFSSLDALKAQINEDIRASESSFSTIQ